MPKSARLRTCAVAAWPNLVWAAHRVCRGKQNRADVQRLQRRLDDVLSQVRVAILNGTLPVGRFDAFQIYDPKHRVIHAAPLPDRIAHHALSRFIEPAFERVLMPSVFACRKGKGVHRAIDYAQRQSRRFEWMMHVDVRHYFPAIDHEVLVGQLNRRFRGDGRDLLAAVVDAYHSKPGKGFPIGALTSQHFANHYLNGADRWCLRQTPIKAHCRYMDDFLLWSDSADGLRRVRDSLIVYLERRLKLTAKPPLIQRSRIGVRFCGVHVRPYTLRPSQRRRRRFQAAYRRANEEWRAGLMSATELQRRWDAAAAILLPADSPSWRAHCVSKDVLDV